MLVKYIEEYLVEKKTRKLMSAHPHFCVLFQINTDLKKLLVASVGDDLHWKMDALIQ